MSWISCIFSFWKFKLNQITILSFIISLPMLVLQPRTITILCLFTCVRPAVNYQKKINNTYTVVYNWDLPETGTYQIQIWHIKVIAVLYWFLKSVMFLTCTWTKKFQVRVIICSYFGNIRISALQVQLFFDVVIHIWINDVQGYIRYTFSTRY